MNVGKKRKTKVKKEEPTAGYACLVSLASVPPANTLSALEPDVQQNISLQGDQQPVRVTPVSPVRAGGPQLLSFSSQLVDQPAEDPGSGTEACPSRRVAPSEAAPFPLSALLEIGKPFAGGKRLRLQGEGKKLLWKKEATVLGGVQGLV